MFRRKQQIKIEETPVAAGPESYRPGLFYFTTARAGADKAWAGPKYLNNTRWRSDLIEVIGQIQAVVETNANLAGGLEAAAREHRRQLRDWTQRRIGLLFRVGFIPGILIFLFLFVVATGGVRGAEALGYSALIATMIFTGYGIIAFYNAGTVEAVLLKLRDDLESGRQLSEAMRRMDRFFPPVTADLVAMGEQTGQLGKTLGELNGSVLNYVRHNQGLGRQGLYFLCISAAQLGIIIFISIKVFPVFVEILSEYGAPLPASAAATIGLADFVVERMTLSPHDGFKTGAEARLRQLQFYTLLFAFAFAGWWLLRGGARRIRTAPRAGMWLYVPILKNFVRNQNLASIGQLMAALLRSGMPLPEALDRVARCKISGAYRGALVRTRTRIENGECVGDAFAPETRCFPPGFQAFVRLGERSGLLAEAFSRTADQYRQRHETSMHYLRSLVTPIGIMVLGSVNLLVCMAAFDMIIAISSSIMEDM